MDKEMITVCEEDGTARRIATREEIHKKGLWHETFHCWIVEVEDSIPSIHLQLRSPAKKDFPDLLDISAAGHILAHETIVDGVREIEEELGIKVEFDELIPLGIVADQLKVQNFIDNERCHVFLYRTEEKLDRVYQFQEEEVAGMFKFKFEEFHDLCTGAVDKIESTEGISAKGKLAARWISLADLVPHSRSYLEQVVQAIQLELMK